MKAIAERDIILGGEKAIDSVNLGKSDGYAIDFRLS